LMKSDGIVSQLLPVAMGPGLRRDDELPNLPRPRRRPYIQRLPQRGNPHMAGSTARAFVQGCLPNAFVPLHCS
jgi:hypothetical protein